MGGSTLSGCWASAFETENRESLAAVADAGMTSVGMSSDAGCAG